MRLLQLGMIHPLIPDQIEEFAAGLDEIIVVEEKRAVRGVGRQADPLRPTGRAPRHRPRPRRRPAVPARGRAGRRPRSPGVWPNGWAARRFPTVDTWRARTARPRAVTQLPLVARTPYFCSGCPHNSSTKVPAGSLVGGGIGCHALVLMMAPDAVGEVIGLTQMGGEGAQWIGMAPFLRTRKHLLQNIGDGTFHHSGSLAVRAAIASGADITYKLLYNSAVAMTGGQRRGRRDGDPRADPGAGRRGSAPHHRHHRRAPPVPAPPAPAPARPAGQHRRGVAPGPAGRGAGDAEPNIRRHRPHPRPGVRHGAAPQAQARPGPRARRSAS